MIRNVVVGRLHDGLELSVIEPGLAAIAALAPAGLVECRLGTDLRLRSDRFDFVITNDFVDEASYRAYDTDPEHNRIRAELFAPHCAQIVRVQFDLDQYGSAAG